MDPFVIQQTGDLWRAGPASRPVPRDALADLGRRYRPDLTEAALADLGRALWRALDGLQPPPGTPIELRSTDPVVLAAPWELLHDGTAFLVDDLKFNFARRLGPPTTPRPRSDKALTLLFMAASPTGVGDRLRHEDEERALLQATEAVHLDLYVDETGALPDLALRHDRLAAHGPVDVLHLTAHGTAHPAPALQLEDRVGAVALTSPDDLARHLRLPRLGLCVVSACSTADASDAAHAFVHQLVEKGAPAALGWARPVRDVDATAFAAALYAHLARGWTVPEAVAAAQRAIRTQRGWHQARLLLGPSGGGPLAHADRPGRSRDREVDAFLDDRRRVPVAGPDAFVGRRRELQRALRALDDSKPVLVYGLGHQGKTSLAARVARRLGGPVAVAFGADDLDAGAVYAAVAHAGGVGEARDVAEAITRLRDDPGLLSGLLTALWRRLHPRPLLVLDNLEDALDLHEDAPRVQDAAHAIVLRGALRAAADAAAPLVLTCRQAFELPDHRGRDLLGGAEVIALDGLSPEERRLLPRVRSAGVDADARDACLDASGGNPGLLDQLLRLAAEVDRAALDNALVALRDAHETGQGALDAWLHDVVGQLVDLLTPAQRALLVVSGVLVGPAPEAAVRAAWSGMVGATSADADRLIRLGLWVRVPDPERPEAFAVVPQALATRRAGDVGDRAAGAAAALLAAWAPEPSAHTAATVTRLALVAGDRRVIIEHAVLALQVGLGRHDIPPTQALAREVAAALPDDVPEQLALALSNVLALEDPGAALAVLERSGGPLAHGRRGQLLIRRGELAGAEAAFRESLAGLVAGTREYAVMLGGIADILQARGQLDEALRIRTDEQLPVFEQLGDTREAAVTLGKIAEIYQRWGHVDVALHIFRDVQLPIFDRVGDKREAAFALGRVADIVAARGDLREALRIQTDEVLPTFVALGDLQSQAVTHGQIADIHQTQGELAEALRIRTEHELPAFESLGATRERAVTLGKIADILGAFGQLDEALRFRLEEELPIFERIGDAREIAVTLGGVADLMRARGQLDEAMRIHIDRRLPIYRQMGDVREQAVTWGRIADILQIQGRLDEAHRIRTDEELPILQRIGEVREIAIATGKMADIAMARGQLDDALKTFTDHVLPAFERVGDVRSQAVTRGRIADVHWLRGELREALLVLTDYVMPAYEQLGDTREKILTIARMADIEGHLGKVDDAIRVYVAKVIPAFTQHRAPLDLLVHQARLAVLLSWRGDPTDVLAARDLFIEALRAARQHGFPVEERQIVDLMKKLNCPADVIDSIR